MKFYNEHAQLLCHLQLVRIVNDLFLWFQSERDVLSGTFLGDHQVDGPQVDGIDSVQ